MQFKKITLLVLLCLLISCGSTADETPLRQFDSEYFDVQFSYPDNWRVVEDGNGILATNVDSLQTIEDYWQLKEPFEGETFLIQQMPVDPTMVDATLRSDEAYADTYGAHFLGSIVNNYLIDPPVASKFGGVTVNGIDGYLVQGKMDMNKIADTMNGEVYNTVFSVIYDEESKINTFITSWDSDDERDEDVTRLIESIQFIQ